MCPFSEFKIFFLNVDPLIVIGPRTIKYMLIRVDLWPKKTESQMERKCSDPPSLV